MRNKAPSTSASLDDWLRWQEALHPQAIALGLERVRPVAERLGLPAQGICTVTVAGTNGKGSSTALLSEIYLAAGYRVGTYSSPHLLRYNERVAVDGRALGDEDLIRAFVAVEAARGETALTYFEFGTVAALWLFGEAKVALQVLEVGMGGRLDAVNLVDADVALVTNIGLDHVEFLGRTREQIAMEKAGILRAGRPAVCVDPDAPRAIREQAGAIGAPLWQLDEDYRYQRAADAWNWHGPGLHYKKLPPPALAGQIQYRNAAGVIAAVTRLQAAAPVPETAIRAGLVRVRLPGRFERRVLRDERGTAWANVILDVAHNIEAARALAENLRTLCSGGLRVVVGMLSDKPVAEFCATLVPLAQKFYAGGLPPPRGLASADLAGKVRRAASKVEAFATVEEAFDRARTECRLGETILVCGSFLTVAAVLRLLNG